MASGFAGSSCAWMNKYSSIELVGISEFFCVLGFAGLLGSLARNGLYIPGHEGLSELLTLETGIWQDSESIPG
jgi:hypothetical protein